MRLRLGLGGLCPLILTAIAAQVVAAQSVMVAPSAVIMREGAPSTALTLISHDTLPVEITVSTAYGYPVTDSAGHVFLRTFDSLDDTMPAASAWVTSYPRRLVIEPGARRTVRLVATPPRDLPPGEYWGRVVVSAKGGRATVVNAGEGIDARIDMEIRSVIGLFYRKGSLHTGVSLGPISAAREGDSVVVRPQLVREGTAAFVGTVRVELRDRSDSVRAQTLMPLGVYYTLAPRLTLPVSDLAQGEYRVVVSASATRPDLPSSALTPAASVRAETTLALP